MKPRFTFILFLFLWTDVHIWANPDSDTLILSSKRNNLFAVNFEYKQSSILITAIDSTRRILHQRSFPQAKNDSLLRFKTDSIKKLYSQLIDSFQLTEESISQLEKKMNHNIRQHPVYCIIIKYTDSLNVATHPNPDLPINGGSNNQLNSWLICLLIGLLAGAIFMFLFLRIFRKPRSEQNDSSEMIIAETVDILHKGFPLRKKDKHLPRLADECVSTYINMVEEHKDNAYRLDVELKEKNNMIGRLTESVEELRTFLHSRDEKIVQLEKTIEEKTSELINNNLQFEEQKNLATTIISKFYYPLRQDVENNRFSNEEELIKYTMCRLFQIAFHSISCHRMLIRPYSDDDQSNINMLLGRAQPPATVVNINTDRQNMDRLTFIVLRILEEKGISKLDDVLVHGYKIG